MTYTYMMKEKKFRRLSEEKRFLIVQAASELFLNSGYGSVSMDMIAERAQVSKRTVYNHFADKNSLFAEVVKQTWEILEPCEIIGESRGSIREDLYGFSVDMLEILRSDRFISLLRLVMGESGRFPELTELYARNSIRPFLKRLEVYFVSKAEAGALKAGDYSLASQQFIGMVKESLFWPVMLGILPVPSSERDREVIESSIEIFLDTYGV